MAEDKEVTNFIQRLVDRKEQSLRPHQLEGLKFMAHCWKSGHGCILADEMGLGKTCQASAMVSYLQHLNANNKISYLIICPLSVLDHWKNEPTKFGFDLSLLVYRGDKDEREQLRKDISRAAKSWKTILTTYELLMNDADFFAEFNWTAVIVDEAHRLKNMESVMHNILSHQIKYKWILLLTGTPVQNNLNEFYALLSLCHQDEFPRDMQKRFAARFSDTTSQKAMGKLQQVLKRYVLRRTKDIACTDLPTKSEIILFHNLTDLQKELYRAILMKNYDIFDQGAVDKSKQRLMNTLIQLRKCVGHPYLFDGIEPEPFEQGEHLVEASGKLLVLDVLLAFLKKHGHKVLLFSQMTRMLDVVQDFLTYRGYSYERLDGSVRGEERFAAVQRFVNTETFCFLLSTRAGGLGLNLMAADTVIFLDSDFNPQNDLQAAARAHRMGQQRHVKIIRLIGRRTVEEIILARAASKLKLTNTILQEKSDDSAKVLNASEISDMLMFGLSELGKHQQKASDIDFAKLETLLGKSENNRWLVPEGNETKDWINDVELKDIYTFEGKDYREESKQADREAFEDLRRTAEALPEDVKRIPNLRETAISVSTPRQKKVYTEQELAQMREKREKALEQRKLAAEEERKRKEAERKVRLMRLWEDNDYKSARLPDVDVDDQSTDLDTSNDLVVDDQAASGDATNDPIFVIGDVTKPELQEKDKSSDAIIVHCVDDSGSWGKGGVFSALSALSKDIESHYELAKRMKDLAVGDVHVIKVKDKDHDANVGTVYVALIVAQRHNKRGEIVFDAIEGGLRKLGDYAAKNQCTVHLPRIGYGMVSFNWYAAERLIRKLLCRRGVSTYVYYFPRKQQKRRHGDGSADRDQGRKTSVSSNDERKSYDSDHSDSDHSMATSSMKDSRAGHTNGSRKRVRIDDDEDSSGDGELPDLPSLFEGYNFYFADDISKNDVRRLRRFIIGFGGQETPDGDFNSCTHIVVENSLTKDSKFGTCGKSVVTRGWLEKCINEKKLLPIDDNKIFA